MADNQTKIDEFVEITGVPKKHAEEILKRYNWNKEEAVEAFLAGDEYDVDEEMDTAPPVQPVKPVASTSEASGKTGKTSMLDVWDEERKNKKGKDGQYFYVGGEHSGEVVIGPDRDGDKGKRSSDMVQRLFESAKEHGAEQVGPDDEEEPEEKPKVKPFGGSGYRLGTANETAASSSSYATASRQATEDSQSPSKKPTRNYRLHMWENGFSIDDGELRSYDDPEGQRFLNSITKGRIPEELLRAAGGAEVHVDLEDRRNEEYTPPAKPRNVAFTGEGHRLGSVVPPMSTDAPVVAPQAAAAASAPAPKQEEVRLEVDETQPLTNIQIRLADGSRLVVKANHTHTIAQLRDFIRRARPQLARSPFVLMTMMPNRELTDDSLTVADAGLLNAAIVQRAGKA